MFYHRRKDIQIQNFWKWFHQFVQEADLALKEGRDLKLDPLLHALNRIREGLSAKVTRRNKTEWTLTISANGDINKFDIVEAIVHEAPTFPNWHIVAFRQPTPYPVFKLEVEGFMTLDVEEMSFLPLIDQQHLDIIVFIPNIEGEEREWVAYYGLMIVDMIIGEYDCVTKVRFYDFHDDSKREATDEVIPMKALKQFIDHHYEA